MLTRFPYNKTIALYGLGISGLSALRALQEGGVSVRAWDDNPQVRTEAEQAGATLASFDNFDDIEALVLSPGIALDYPAPHPIVKQAQEAGLPLIGDMRLFADSLALYKDKSPIIAVTGTNGKSTTAALIAHLLRGCGYDVQVGGNIGQSVLTLEPPQEGRVYVLELSSYQLALTPDFVADVGVLLNITPDHLDRHGTFAHYGTIKWHLLSALPKSAYAVLGADCPEVQKRYEASSLSARTLQTSGEDKACDVFVREGVLYDEQGAVADLKAIATLRGVHNWQNATAAYASARAIGASREALATAFTDFAGLAHRLQPIADYKGVSFVNDSKATNIEATDKALSAYEDIYWIAGGRAKDDNLAPLSKHFSKLRKAYLIGEAMELFASYLEGKVAYNKAERLEQAVPQASQDALEAGAGVVLLSPACASFDHYKNFEERGEAFCQAVATTLAGERQ